MEQKYIIKIEEVKDEILFQTLSLVSFEEEFNEEDVTSIMSGILINLYGENSGEYNEEEEAVFYPNGIKAKLVYDKISEEEFVVLEKYIPVI